MPKFGCYSSILKANFDFLEDAYHEYYLFSYWLQKNLAHLSLLWPILKHTTKDLAYSCICYKFIYTALRNIVTLWSLLFILIKTYWSFEKIRLSLHHFNEKKNIDADVTKCYFYISFFLGLKKIYKNDCTCIVLITWCCSENIIMPGKKIKKLFQKMCFCPILKCHNLL